MEDACWEATSQVVNRMPSRSVLENRDILSTSITTMLINAFKLWHACFTPELCNRQKGPLLGNGYLNTINARHWLSIGHVVTPTGIKATIEYGV
jgi:hypothetical protein